MFPQAAAAVETVPDSQTPAGKNSFLFDFSTGEFVIVDGKPVDCTGDEAIKVWIDKALHTKKGRWEIYGGEDYGIQIEDLIVGAVYPKAFVEAELRREFQEMLLKNSEITGISSFTTERSGSTLTISFQIDTKNNGTIAQEVVYNV